MIRLNFADPRTKKERRTRSLMFHSGPIVNRRFVPNVGSSIVTYFWDHTFTCDREPDYAGSVRWSHDTNPPYRLRWVITDMIRSLLR